MSNVNSTQPHSVGLNETKYSVVNCKRWKLLYNKGAVQVSILQNDSENRFTFTTSQRLVAMRCTEYNGGVWA